jgi:hypothetical protein
MYIYQSELTFDGFLPLVLNHTFIRCIPTQAGQKIIAESKQLHGYYTV